MMQRRKNVALLLLALACLLCISIQALDVEGGDLLSIVSAHRDNKTGKSDFQAALITRTLSHYIQAGIYERLNQLDKAVREYKAALKADFNSSQIHLRLAVVLLKQNKLTPAADELKLAIKYYESSTNLSEEEDLFIEAHTLLALVYSLQGKLDEATAEYEIALRGVLAVDPQNISIYKSLARLYFQQQKYSDAEKTCKFILNLSPEDFDTYFMLGNIYEQQGRRQEAIEKFKATLKFNPDYTEALNSLGYLYAEESINLRQAEEMLKKALFFEPNNGAYIDSLGWIHFKQGRYEDAIRELERAVGILPDPVAYEHLGDAYIKQGNISKARENWQESLKMDPQDNAGIRKKLEQHKVPSEGVRNGG